MKKITILQVIGFMTLANLCQMQGIQMQSLPASRSVPPLCVTCPAGAAKFCSLCVTGPVVVGDLTVQGSLTLCPGVTGPTGLCACVYDGYLSWNSQETNYNQKNYPDSFCEACPDITIPFNIRSIQTFGIIPGLGGNAIFSGWNIVPSDSGPNLTITAEFEVPGDLDPSVPPIVTLHWFNESILQQSCTASGFVNWEVTANSLGNGESFGVVTEYDVTTGDIALITGASNVQQQASVVLATGPGFTPGGYAQISTTRVATTGANLESTCTSILSLIGFKYRKTPQ